MRTFYSLRSAHFHISALSLLLHITNVLCKFSNPWLLALAGLGVVQHSAQPASCWVADELRVQDAKESKVGKATKQGSERWRETRLLGCFVEELQCPGLKEWTGDQEQRRGFGPGGWGGQ